jgi:hypothetical protein
VEELEPGVALIDTTEAATSATTPRVTLSSGLQPAPKDFSLIGYNASAIVPRDCWREPNVGELQILQASSSSSPPGSWISVLTFPTPIFEAFRQLRGVAESMTDRDQMNPYIGGNDWRDAMDAFATYVGLYGHPDEITGQKGMSANYPGLPTVTVDYSSGCLVGLHLDSWFRTPLNERHVLPNRIAMNLGFEDRYFLYVNLPVKRIWEHVHQASAQDAAPIPLESDLLESFMRLYPTYPVVRLRIGPGEGYIAPTENVIHDGSTLGMTNWDLYLTMLGYFRPWPASQTKGAFRSSNQEES